MMRLEHLLWIPAGAAAAFLASLFFGDVLTLPVDLYYLIYFVVVVGFFALYVERTGLALRTWISRRLIWGLLLGIAGGIVMYLNVLSRPAEGQLTGGALAWAVFWRGLAYGSVDGLLLFAFPWIVTWRAFDAEQAGWGKKAAVGLFAWLLILFVTTAYHLGYADFRTRKILQPNIGSAITAVPTLVSANPVASPLTHVFLHVAAVTHTPETDLFLPPHRE